MLKSFVRPVRPKAFTLLEALVALAITALLLTLGTQVFGQTLQASQKATELAYLEDQADYALDVLERDLRKAHSLHSPKSGRDILSLTYSYVPTKDNVPQWHKAFDSTVTYSLSSPSDRRKTVFYRKEPNHPSFKQLSPVAQLYRSYQEGDRAWYRVTPYDANYLPIENMEEARYLEVTLHMEPKGLPAFSKTRSMALEAIQLDERRQR